MKKIGFFFFLSNVSETIQDSLKTQDIIEDSITHLAHFLNQLNKVDGYRSTNPQRTHNKIYNIKLYQ